MGRELLYILPCIAMTLQVGRCDSSPFLSSTQPSQIQEETPSKPRRVKQRGNRVSAAASDPDLRESGRKSSKEKDAQVQHKMCSPIENHRAGVVWTVPANDSAGNQT